MPDVTPTRINKRGDGPLPHMASRQAEPEWTSRFEKIPSGNVSQSTQLLSRYPELSPKFQVPMSGGEAGDIESCSERRPESLLPLLPSGLPDAAPGAKEKGFCLSDSDKVLHIPE